MLFTIFTAASIMLALAVVASLVLGWANRAFTVEVDPRVEAIGKVLPGANCGGCGFVGCNDYAEAVVHKGAAVNLCPVGGTSCAASVGAIMGVEVGESAPRRPIVHCNADRSKRLMLSDYRGEQSCAAANLVAGVQGCTYGCLGLGDCVRACNYDAIHCVDGLSIVDYEKCIGCGACAKACPRNIISMVPFKTDRIVAVKCSNKDFGPEVKRVCKVGCIGCKACERNMAALFSITDNLAHVDYEKYDPSMDLGAVMAKCPQQGIVFVGKPSPKDVAATAGEKLPERVEADFKTTVDEAEWRG